MEILPPSPFPNPASSTSPPFPPSPSISHSSIMSFLFSCVHPPRCPEFSSSWGSLSFPSHLFPPPRMSLSDHSRSPSAHFCASPLLNRASNHFFPSCLLISLSPYPLFQSLSLISSPLHQRPARSSPLLLSLPVVSPSPVSLKVHQMVHFSLTQCILIPMAVACRVRAVKTTATVY